MKKIFILVIFLTFSVAAFAGMPNKSVKNLPEGTFKKTRSGTIVQYDKNGKKVGVYKPNSGRYVKIK